MPINKFRFVLLCAIFVKEISSNLIPAAKSSECCGQSIENYDNAQLEKLKELPLLSDGVRVDNLETEGASSETSRRQLGLLMPPPIMLNENTLSLMGQKAFACSQLPCAPEEMLSPVCACNYNTGNVVSFKNECETRMHNCRFDTSFKVILNEICPWEFQSRRVIGKKIFNYNDPKYYN